MRSRTAICTWDWLRIFEASKIGSPSSKMARTDRMAWPAATARSQYQLIVAASRAWLPRSVLTGIGFGRRTPAYKGCTG